MTVSGAQQTGPELDDAQLVARCRAGDPAAWSALVRRYDRFVYAIAVRQYRLNDADAEDVFQEVFARAFEHLERLRDDGAVRPWIAQTARRLCLDRIRSGGRTSPAGDAVDLLPGAEAQASDLELALDVRAALARLPDPAREILDRFFTRDESYRTIGEALEIPQGTVASRVSRALEALRNEIDA